MLENLKYGGELHLTLRGADGEIKDERHVKNTLLNGGRDWLIKTTMDAELTAMTVFTFGTTTSGGVVTVTDTTASDVEEGRMAFTYTTGATVGKASATATFGNSASANAITEAGIYNGLANTSGDGVFFARAMFAAINKVAGDTLEVKWDVSYT